MLELVLDMTSLNYQTFFNSKALEHWESLFYFSYTFHKISSLYWLEK